jgi:hypothetical protein
MGCCRISYFVPLSSLFDISSILTQLLTMEILKRIVSVVVIASAMSSCTFEKRMYMSGYNVEWSRTLANTGKVNSGINSTDAGKALSMMEPVVGPSAAVLPVEVDGPMIACVEEQFSPVGIAEVTTLKHATQLASASEESCLKGSAKSRFLHQGKVEKRAFESYGLIYFLLGTLSFLLMLLTYYAVLAIVNEIASQQ